MNIKRRGFLASLLALFPLNLFAGSEAIKNNFGRIKNNLSRIRIVNYSGMVGSYASADQITTTTVFSYLRAGGDTEIEGKVGSTTMITVKDFFTGQNKTPISVTFPAIGKVQEVNVYYEPASSRTSIVLGGIV